MDSGGVQSTYIWNPPQRAQGWMMKFIKVMSGKLAYNGMIILNILYYVILQRIYHCSSGSLVFKVTPTLHKYVRYLLHLPYNHHVVFVLMKVP